jgi:CRP-like cAMP-binding protein
MPDPTDSLALFVARLRESLFFEPVGDQGLALLAAGAKDTLYPAGAIIFGEGEPSQGLYWVQSGTLKAVKYSTSGPGEAIRHLIGQDPMFAQVIIDVLALRLRSSVDLIEDLSLRPVINRLSRLILDEAEGDALFRPAWYTQNELASRLGTVGDVVQRALRRLEEESVIQVERQQILILDRDALEQLAL